MNKIDDVQMNKIEIRSVLISELEQLQQLGKTTFYESFAKDNTEENMSYYLSTAFSLKRLTKELTHPDSQFYFATDSHIPVGYLKINMLEAQTEFQDPDSLEIERIYVKKSHQGNGIGRLFFQKALSIAQAHDVRRIWLGVWEHNPLAMKFYKRLGFRAFDTHIYPLGDDPQTDILMELPI